MSSHRRPPFPPRLETLEARAVPAVIGYYDLGLGQGKANQLFPIQQSGHTPRLLTDLTANDLTGVDVLVVQNPDNFGYGAEYVSRLSSVAAFVASGKTLVFHDRNVDGAESVLPGGLALDIRRDFLDPNNITVLAPSSSLFVNGPGGTVTNGNLDGQGSSSHGYALASSLPAGSIPLLSRGNTSELVTFAYRHGKGYVAYSSIPLDYHLDFTGSPVRNVYATNVVAYAVDLLNIAPVARGGSASGDEDGVITGRLGASDADGDALTFEVVQHAAHGTVTILDPATGLFQYVPNADYNGTDSFTFRVDDGRDVSDEATVTLDVRSLNDAPDVQASGNNGDEGEPVAFNALATDADGDPLVYEWHFGDGAVGFGPQPTHTYDDNGTYTVTVMVDDGQGGLVTEELTVTIANVAPQNVSAGPDQTGDEGQAVTFSGSFADPGSDTHTVAWVVRDASGGQVATGAGNELTFTPTDDGTYTVVLIVTDDDGDSSSATAVLTVSNVAPQSVSAGPNQEVEAGSAAAFSGSFADPGSDTHVLVWAVQDQAGTTVATGSGPTFTYTPKAAGTYTVAFTVTDDDGGSASDSLVLTVTAPSPPPPTEGPKATLSGPGDGVRGQPRAFAATVSDFPSAVFGMWQVQDARGKVVARGGGLRFLFSPEQAGEYRLTFTARDFRGRSATATSTLQVSVAALQPDFADPSKTQLVVGGTTRDDVLWFSPGRASGSVEVFLNGSSLGTFKPTGHLIAYGQDGDDRIGVDPRLSLPAVLHGGDGHDKLSGGGGNDILIGGSGCDELKGNDGRDLLFGGEKTDVARWSREDLVYHRSEQKDLNGLDELLTRWMAYNPFGHWKK